MSNAIVSEIQTAWVISMEIADHLRLEHYLYETRIFLGGRVVYDEKSSSEINAARMEVLRALRPPKSMGLGK